MLHPVSTKRDYDKCLFFAGVVEIDDDDDEEDDEDDQVTFFKFTLSMLELVHTKFLEYTIVNLTVPSRSLFPLRGKFIRVH